MDLRHPPTPDDISLWSWLKEKKIPAIPILTKADKLSRAKWNPLAQAAGRILGISPADFIIFSAQTQQGRNELLLQSEDEQSKSYRDNPGPCCRLLSWDRIQSRQELKPLTLGYSPCPNDTFIFFALAEKRIEFPFALDVLIADVEMLNRRAALGARRYFQDFRKCSAEHPG